MGFNFFILVFLGFILLSATLAHDIKRATIAIDGTQRVSETDENFICATIDWWPHDKCDYNQCPWGYSSAANMDLSHPVLTKVVQAFRPLRLRIGGSLQDQVIYDVGSLKTPCHPFREAKDGMFGFTKGCLHMQRWDELNNFRRKTGAMVTFGLNALNGRHKLGGKAMGGAWDSKNARDFMNYTVSKGYHIDSWEFGNELSGTGVAASVSAELYGKDLISLKNIINELYKNSPVKPLLVAPGGFYDQKWFAKLLDISGPGVLNVMTHHIYNLGPGNDPKIVNNILDPDFLSRVSTKFEDLDRTIQKHGPWASAWVGESGGAYNSGGKHISDAFVDSFWYLDQLGLASKHNTKVFCRQTLVGGFYGLLEKNTFVPNPDYYSALLWHRLMGKDVLAIHSDAPAHLRAYAHCTKGRVGVTLLLINLSKQSAFIVSVHNGKNLIVNMEAVKKKSFLDTLKYRVSWVGNRASDGHLIREEYHLTPKNNDLHSKTMVLNGKPLQLTATGDVPDLQPVRLNIRSPIYILPLSISFIVLPNFDASVCSR